MNLEDDPIAQDLRARVFAASTDADRAALAREIACRPAYERGAWNELLADSRSLRTAIATVAVPAGLATRLLKVPGPGVPWYQRLASQPLTWKPVTALIAAAVAIGLYLARPTPSPSPLPTLNADLAEQIAAYALQLPRTPPSTGPGVLDPKQAFLQLQTRSLPFQPMILMPCEPMELQAAGVTPFGPSVAAYTRWQSGRVTYTVYQFNGTSLGVPAAFGETVAAQPSPNLHVDIWPGANGACCWVTIAENADRPNPFISGY